MLVVAFIFIASFFHVELVWNMADMFNGLMVLPNLAALLLLSPVVIRLTREIGQRRDDSAVTEGE